MGTTGISRLGISERTCKPFDPPAVRLTISGPLDFVDKTPIVAKY